MVYVDATDTIMTADGNFRPELFRKDGIHLNRDGQRLWGAIIKNAIEGVMQDEKSKKALSS
jgi:lysophospholipase L1-like esterase